MKMGPQSKWVWATKYLSPGREESFSISPCRVRNMAFAGSYPHPPWIWGLEDQGPLPRPCTPGHPSTVEWVNWGRGQGRGGGRRSYKMVQCTSPSLCTVNRRRYLVTLLQRLP